MEGTPEIKEFVLGFVLAIVAVIIGVNLLSPLQNATGTLPVEYAWVGRIIFIVATLGILLFSLRAFRMA